MPLLLPYIDEIPSETRSGAVTIQFSWRGSSSLTSPKQDGVRQYILSWLADQKIVFQPCGPLSSSGRIEGESGEVYVDLAWNESDPKFRKLQNLLYKEDGKARVDGVQLNFYPYP